MAFFLLYRHAANINRLVLGTETRLGQPTPNQPPQQRANQSHTSKTPP